MKCLVCGADNPEGKKFCGDCGGMLPQPQMPSQYQSVVAVQTQRGWLESNWRMLFAVATVAVVILASVGLIYTQPWSKIKVIVNHDEHSAVTVRVFIDGELKASVDVAPLGGWKIVGVWPVSAGNHVVAVDCGGWYFVDNLVLADYWAYEDPDGDLEFLYDYEVGPLYTKNAYVQL